MSSTDPQVAPPTGASSSTEPQKPDVVAGVGGARRSAGLSLEQMAAIRSYMLKLVAIPGTLLAVISALTGYVIGQHEDAAVAQAVTQQTLPLITEAAKQTGLANGEAKSAAAQVNTILEEMKTKSASIQQLTDSLKKSSDEAKANFSQFAKDLVADAQFRDALGKAYQSDLSALKANLLKWGPSLPNAPASGPSGGAQNAPSLCPEGSYMVGAMTNSNTAPPYCIGCLVSVQAICRPLKL